MVQTKNILFSLRWMNGYTLLISLILCVSCSTPHTKSYQDFYAHLEMPCYQKTVTLSDYFLVILVDARHLDYTNNHSFFTTLAKHPSDGSKTGDIGHAWVYLEGIVEGQRVYLEGGHSGEIDTLHSKYFEGVMNYIDYGYANPNWDEYDQPRYEPNPIKYLWTSRRDGFFQIGNGGHTPTFAIKVNLTPEHFHRMLTFIENYSFKE